MSLETKKFGTTKDGEEVTLYSLTNTNGMKAEFINYGANIVSLYVPGKDGKLDDVVLGFDDVAGYEVNGCFFGSFIGRHGNRIGGAQYEAEASEDSVTFSRISPDMEQGYPGNLDIRVTYTLTEDNELKIQYDAKSDKDTLCNVTNHSYFNLKGHDGGVVTGHKVWIKANGFTETSDDLIPNGTIVDVTGTPMDFRTKKAIGDEIEADYKPLKIAGGYDHNFALDKKAGQLEKVAELSEDTTGRTMEVYTDLPGMQLYTGNFIKKEMGKNGAVYTKRCGVCFETQFFPNSIHVPSFDSCVLKAGETFTSTTVYRFCH